MKKIIVISIITLVILARSLAAVDAPFHPDLPATVQSMHRPALQNLFRLTTNHYSGSTPQGDKGFAALADLGIKTIISVDGAKPDLALARQFGLRYVHLPLGYDGISHSLQVRLIQAADTLPGPFYIHCHHGRHRGPAAAAVICLAQQNWTPDQARIFLVAAGTSTNYVGLYEVIRTFKKPSHSPLQASTEELPEVAEVSRLTDSMVGIDQRWDHLQAVRAAGYRTPKDNPDIQPAHEAFILWEHYREAQRLPESLEHGAKFVQMFQSAESELKNLSALLHSFAASPSPRLQLKLDRSFDAIGKSCTACHNSYRNPIQPLLPGQ